MNGLQVFQNSEFGELRVLDIDGKPYFPAAACAKKLGYADPQKAIRDHCKRVNEIVIPTKGGTQIMRFVPEGDLCRLIVSSKLPGAERFEKWVFDEVLPAVRKTGSYGPNDQTAIIVQTATAVCAEMVKQLTPLLQPLARPSMIVGREILEPEPSRPRFRKKPSGIIENLCPEIRKEVEEMLCDGRHTYADIATKLKRKGIQISTQSVFRYAKRNNCYSAYEVRK